MPDDHHRPAPLQGVRQGKETQRVVGRGEVEEGVKSLQLGQGRTMADHDSLGLPSGPRGVNEGGDVVGA